MAESTRIIESYSQLRLEWGESRRSQGGVNALRGFDYQLLSTLLKIAESKTLFGKVSSEQISDITEIQNGKIIVTQSKLTLSSKALHEALDELWELFLLISVRFPELNSVIRFAIQSARQDLKNPKVSVENWGVKAKIENDPPLVDVFLAKISICIEPEPFDHLVQVLIYDYAVEKPYASIDEWVGSLYRSIPDNSQEAVCNHIRARLSDFKSEKEARGKRCNFYLWKDSDLPPSVVVREPNPNHAILVGQLPRIHHLVEGRFAERRAYKSIYDDFSSWAASVSTSDRGKLSVFWLRGRSGSGKSVALLHLLSKIKEESAGSEIAWFGNNVSALDGFLRYVPDLTSNSSRLYLAIDDPFSFENQGDFVRVIKQIITDFEYLLSSDQDQQMPSIICCGPDEQFEWCSDQLSDELLIHPYTLKDETVDDIDELKSWYEKRTGVPVVEHEKAQSDVLLVQVFQWVANESLVDFARRFKKRLSDDRWKCEGTSPYDLVGMILYANRLYARFPSEGYSEIIGKDPYLESAMAVIRSENHHISLDDDGLGIRLTHPKLSDILYRQWYSSRRDKPFRRQQLQRWLEVSERFGRNPSETYAPLWVLANLSKPGLDNDISSRIELIKDDLTEFLPQYYGSKIDAVDLLAFLPVWSTLDTNLQLGLSPSPLDLILDVVSAREVGETGYRLCCHKLIEYYDRLGEVGREKATEFIRGAARSHEWPALAADYALRVGLEGIYDEVADFVSDKPSLFASRKLVHMILSRHERFGEGGKAIVSQWLVSVPVESPPWPGMFTDYASAHGIAEEVWEKGISFLSEHSLHKSWSFVWQALWKADVGNSQLLNLGLGWISKRFNQDRGWSFVWCDLADWDRSNEKLIELGLSFLKLSAEAPKARSIVLDKLNEIRPDDLAVESILLEWLETTGRDHRDWVYRWTPLAKKYPKDANIINMGREWLLEADVLHPTWFDTLSRVWDVSHGDVELNRRLIEWLERAEPAHDSWQYNWERSWNFDSGNQKLIDLGVSWLSSTPGAHGGWNRVWECIWDSRQEERDVLVSIGRHWLESIDKTHPGWVFVFQRILPELTPSSSAADFGMKVLAAAPICHQHWAKAWESVWKVSRSQPGLVELGRRWLDECDANRKIKRALQTKLEAAGSIEDKLSLLKEKWTSRSP